MGRYLVCISGASGSIYGKSLVEALLAMKHQVYLVFSHWGKRVFEEETGLNPDEWLDRIGVRPQFRYESDDLAAPPSSGSFILDGTVIVPASMGTVGAIASGASANLVQRAASVALKERRTLIIVPRESPLSLIHLKNLCTLTEAGAIIMPASPGFYHKPDSIESLVGFMTGRILDSLNIENSLASRWNGSSGGNYESS